MSAVKVKKQALWGAIREKCKDCQGGDAGQRWGIGNCPDSACPLHPYRPYQNKQGQPPEGVYKDTDL